MRVGCGFFIIFRAHTTKLINAAAINNDTGRKNHRTRHPGKTTRDQGPTKNQPTDRRIHALTRDFSALTRETCHGSSRSDPHETASRGSPGLWRVGSGRVRRFSNLADRVGLRRLEILAGRVGSGQDVSKSSRVGSGRVNTSRNSHGPGRVS